MFSGTYTETHTHISLSQRDFLSEIVINPYLEEYADVSIELCELFAWDSKKGEKHYFPMSGVERTNPYETSKPVPEYDKVYLQVVIKVDPKDGSDEILIYKTFDTNPQYDTNIKDH